MKKFLVAVLFLGCTNHNLDVNKNIKEVSFEKKLIDKFNISKRELVRGENFYYFVLLNEKGVGIYKIDKKLNILNQTKIKGLIEPQKLLYKNRMLYLLSYDEYNQKPLLIVLDDNLNIKEKQFLADKFNLPKDLIVLKNKVIILLQAYKNQADIEICENSKCRVFSLENNQNPKFIKKFQDGYLVIGSNQSDKEDLLVMFIQNNKLIWKKLYDFGYSDIPESVKIENHKIIIEVKSTDYMGAEKYLKVILDDKGKIIKKEKNIEIDILPQQLRT